MLGLDWQWCSPWIGLRNFQLAYPLLTLFQNEKRKARIIKPKKISVHLGFSHLLRKDSYIASSEMSKGIKSKFELFFPLRQKEMLNVGHNELEFFLKEYSYFH